MDIIDASYNSTSSRLLEYVSWQYELSTQYRDIGIDSKISIESRINSISIIIEI